MPLETRMTIRADDDFDEVVQDVLQIIGERMPDWRGTQSMLGVLMAHGGDWCIDPEGDVDGYGINTDHLFGHWDEVETVIRKHLYNLGAEVQRFSLLLAKDREQQDA